MVRRRDVRRGTVIDSRLSSAPRLEGGVLVVGRYAGIAVFLRFIL
jgi:hypothetical protein